jgi:sarcosine oxidase subunit beta
MLPESADVVIIGAGVVGASIAYHLTQYGLDDVVLLEREALPGTGSTSKANGGIRAQFATEVNIHLSLKCIYLLNSFDVHFLFLF